MFGNYRNRLVPVGLLSLAAGLILHNWLHSRSAEFASGFLIGMSLVFLIAGSIPHSRRRPTSKPY